MKRSWKNTLPALLMGAAALPLLAVSALADVIVPGPAELLLWGLEEHLPALLIVAAVVVTALLVRHYTKKKK